MQQGRLDLHNEAQARIDPGLQSALFFETPREIYERVFRQIKPRSAAPYFHVEFCRFANADSLIQFRDGAVRVRITDLLEGAPAPVVEALAYILLSKLFRKPVAGIYVSRYRVFMNRRDVRRTIHLVRQLRGRKYVSGPNGKCHNLNEVFEELNRKYFDGLMGRPLLGWSKRRSQTRLGHFDPSHNAIIISRIFDDPVIPRRALEYVVFHEMLHLRYPVDHQGTRRRIHTKEFRMAEGKFEDFQDVRALLKKLW